MAKTLGQLSVALLMARLDVSMKAFVAQMHSSQARSLAYTLVQETARIVETDGGVTMDHIYKQVARFEKAIVDLGIAARQHEARVS